MLVGRWLPQHVSKLDVPSLSPLGFLGDGFLTAAFSPSHRISLTKPLMLPWQPGRSGT